MTKTLYKGSFNLRGERLVPLYCHATSTDRAFDLFCRRISKLVGYKPGWVKQEFNGTKDNYKIEVCSKNEQTCEEIDPNDTIIWCGEAK